MRRGLLGILSGIRVVDLTQYLSGPQATLFLAGLGAEVIHIDNPATGDLTAEFPALAARKLGFEDVPLLCAVEISVPGSMPRVVRLMMHVNTSRPRDQLQHVYLRGASALRLDIAQ